MVGDNVVSIERASRHRVEDEARALLPKDEVFARVDSTMMVLEGAERGDVIRTNPVINRSLRLAQEQDFLEMCLPILWGDEKKIHLQRFGYLLRGAIETFKPLTIFELYMVKNVVAAQWRLDRLLTTQGNVYVNEAKKGEIGKYGLPAAAHSARELDAEIESAQRALMTTIDIYMQSVRAAHLTDRERAIN
ncbi:MAG: hypothetical protein ABFD96_10775 [Armatimonadia bacterium]|jgi:hypothetical protein